MKCRGHASFGRVDSSKNLHLLVQTPSTGSTGSASDLFSPVTSVLIDSKQPFGSVSTVQQQQDGAAFNGQGSNLSSSLLQHAFFKQDLSSQIKGSNLKRTQSMPQ